MSKFSSPLAERLYALAGEGFADGEAGDVQGPGWFAKFDREEAILFEDNYGFVSVTTDHGFYGETSPFGIDTFEGHWWDILREVDAFYDGEEG